MNRNTNLLLGILCLAIFLAGCATTSSMPEDHFYRLTTLEPVVKYSNSKVMDTLVVDRVNAFGIYHERAILFTQEGSPETLKYHHYHHWIDKPTTLLREQFIHYLREAELSEYVMVGNGRRDKGIHLQLILKKFERKLYANGDVDVHITLNANVTLENNQPPVLFKDYPVVSRAEDGSMSASIGAFNHGLGQIYQKLTDELVETIKLSAI